MMTVTHCATLLRSFMHKTRSLRRVGHGTDAFKFVYIVVIDM